MSGYKGATKIQELLSDFLHENIEHPIFITRLLEYKKSRQAESLWGILHHDMKTVLLFPPLDTFSDCLMTVKVASTYTKWIGVVRTSKHATASSSLSSAWKGRYNTLQNDSRLLVKGRKSIYLNNYNLSSVVVIVMSKAMLKWCNINSSWIATTVVRFLIAKDGRVIHLPFSNHANNYIQYTHD